PLSAPPRDGCEPRKATSDSAGRAFLQPRTVGCDRAGDFSGTGIVFHLLRRKSTVRRLSQRPCPGLHLECVGIGWNCTPNVGTQDVLIRFSPRAARVSPPDCDDRDTPPTRVA